jgi:hypothetical protein
MDYQQIQIQRKDILQCQNQFFSHNIMCRMLSAAESYYNVIFNANSNIFKYYSNNIESTKSIEKIKKHLLSQIELFRNSYEIYKLDYNGYDYPENLSLRKILSIIENWNNEFKLSKNPDYKYYETIKSIFSDNNIGNSIRNDIKQLNYGKNNKPGQVAYQLMASVPQIQELANKYEKQIERDVINGNYSSKVHINENYSDNKDMINVKNRFNQVIDYHKFY